MTRTGPHCQSSHFVNPPGTLQCALCKHLIRASVLLWCSLETCSRQVAVQHEREKEHRMQIRTRPSACSVQARTIKVMLLCLQCKDVALWGYQLGGSRLDSWCRIFYMLFLCSIDNIRCHTTGRQNFETLVFQTVSGSRAGTGCGRRVRFQATSVRACHDVYDRYGHISYLHNKAWSIRIHAFAAELTSVCQCCSQSCHVLHHRLSALFIHEGIFLQVIYA